MQTWVMQTWPVQTWPVPKLGLVAIRRAWLAPVQLFSLVRLARENGWRIVFWCADAGVRISIGVWKQITEEKFIELLSDTHVTNFHAQHYLEALSFAKRILKNQEEDGLGDRPRFQLAQPVALSRHPARLSFPTFFDKAKKVGRQRDEHPLSTSPRARAAPEHQGFLCAALSAAVGQTSATTAEWPVHAGRWG